MTRSRLSSIAGMLRRLGYRVDIWHVSLSQWGRAMLYVCAIGPAGDEHEFYF